MAVGKKNLLALANLLALGMPLACPDARQQGGPRSQLSKTRRSKQFMDATEGYLADVGLGVSDELQSCQ
jgi:hypothetical protein